MTIWNIVVLHFCKAVYFVLRKSGRHGAALPGLIAEKLAPGLLDVLSVLPDGLIVVSGTNGKTTTTHLTTQVLRRMGKRVFTNHSGSNMTRGLLASIARYSNWRAALPYDVAVLEVDEAYAAMLAPRLKPVGTILTNVLRDQLDRFGEIDHTARLLATLASNTTRIVVYNASDSRLRKLPNNSASAQYVSYGFDARLAEHFPDDDAFYGSGNRQLPKSYRYKLSEAKNGAVTIQSGQEVASIKSTHLPGWHNALNLTAVYSLVRELYGVVGDVFDDLQPPYGRGEKVLIGEKEFILQLVKNPAGFRTAMDVQPTWPALVVINDLIADGRDVSWLWDVDCSPLLSRPALSTCGLRAYDMAVRLKYAGFSVTSIDQNEKLGLEDFVSSHTHGVIFLTYTAMLHMRKHIKGLAQ